MKKHLILATACLALFTSCNKSQSKHASNAGEPKTTERSQVITINILDEPQSLDPRKVRSLRDLNLTRLLMEGLTRTGKSGKAELALASQYEVSNDQQTYTFTLKPSTWSNGDTVTAYDFVYAWKKALTPEYPSDYASQLYPIKNAKSVKLGTLPLSMIGASAPNDHTLVIELEHPVPYMLKLLSLPVFFPVNSKVDKKNPHWADKAETYVGNGPFSLKAWKHRDQLIAQKNPAYWDAEKVKLEKIAMVMVSEETGFSMYQNDELQWDGSPFSTIPMDAINSLRSTPSLRSAPMLGTAFIRTNVSKAPFSSNAIRKAFALAIDRKALVEHVLQGEQTPATGLVPKCMGLQKQPYFMDADREAAVKHFEQGLKDLRVSKNSLPEIVLSYANSERSHRMYQALQQQWFETFGIKVRLEPLESQVYFSKVSKQAFMLAGGSWIADLEDPITFLEVFQSKENGTNNTNWENPLYASTLDASYLTTSLEERNKLLSESERILLQDMPIIPIFHYSMLYVQDSAVKDVVISDIGGIDFKWAYLENDQIISTK